MKSPIFFALDVNDFEQGLSLVKTLSPLLGGVKVGPRLMVQKGHEIVQRLSEFVPVFVDNKYLDIPSTMEAAVRATFDAGASYTTVHALAGPIALSRMAGLQAELSRKRPFQILVVTVLTSFDQDSLPGPLKHASIANHVTELARESFRAGCDGIVCSPFEVGALKEMKKDGFFVTPGVRLEAVAGEDQARVMTPAQAIAAGASALVIGRPLIQAKDPKGLLETIFSELEIQRG